MRKTHATLADGRELIYFDESDDAVRVLHDARRLEPSPTPSTVRFDHALGEWVTLAGHRQDRTHLPPDDECPLCPSAPGRQTEIPSPDYDVVVFENRFPAFVTPPSGAPTPRSDPAGEGVFLERPAAGRCEVVCFTADHETAFSQLSPARVGTVLAAWIDRTEHLSALPYVEQVFVFENRGREIGVTLGHPHGQIYAYPFVTPRTKTMLENARAHHGRTGRNLFADLLAAETAAEERVVARGEHWTAFVPHAARWPLEVHLYPRRQLAGLPDLDRAERHEFAHVYLDVLRRMEALDDEPLPYVAAWHQAPVRQDREHAYLHLEVFSIRRAPGRLKYLAGSESAMGAFVNDLRPEDVARRLRSAGP